MSKSVAARASACERKVPSLPLSRVSPNHADTVSPTRFWVPALGARTPFFGTRRECARTRRVETVPTAAAREGTHSESESRASDHHFLFRICERLWGERGGEGRQGGYCFRTSHQGYPLSVVRIRTASTSCQRLRLRGRGRGAGGGHQGALPTRSPALLPALLPAQCPHTTTIFIDVGRARASRQQARQAPRVASPRLTGQMPIHLRFHVGRTLRRWSRQQQQQTDYTGRLFFCYPRLFEHPAVFRCAGEIR